MKKFTLLLMAALLAANSYAVTDYTITGTGSDLTLTITGTGDMPDYTGGNSTPWYSQRANIKTLIIEDGVTSIGNNAFESCSGLTSVTIPNSVTSIGNLAFYYCSGLTSVTIPNSVISISYAFGECSGLISINVDANNSNYSSLDGILYNKTQTALIKCPAGKTGSFIIPNSVTSIRQNAFESCSSLTSVTIPNSVTSIGYAAFRDCSGLTSVTIPNSVTSMEDYPFFKCTSLTSINVDVNNPNYSSLDGVLYNKAQTILIKYPEGKTGSFIIPNSVTAIFPLSFYNCGSLTSVTIPNSVTSIYGEAEVFAYCSGLTSINVDVNNPNYSSLDGVLYNKAQTILIKYPEGKTGSFIIPNSVTAIQGSGFYYCSGLTSVTIPNSVTSMEGYPFFKCTSLTSINVDVNNPNYSSIDGVLYNKTQTILICYPAGKTGSFIIPNSVNSIGFFAFYGCSGLTSITIPNSVTSIGYEDFDYCSSLTSVTCNATTPPTIYNNTFSNIGNNAMFYVPECAIDTYKSAPFWKDIENFTGTDIECVNAVKNIKASELSIYPNPVTSELHIDIPFFQKMEYLKVTITDLSGRTVGALRATPLHNGGQTINISTLPQGVYLVRVGNDIAKLVKE